MGRTVQTNRKEDESPLHKIRKFITSSGKFPLKTVRNAGFAGKHAKFHIEDESAWLKYWDTKVGILKGNIIKIDMGGFRRPATRDAINIFLGHTGATIRMVRKNWKYVLLNKKDRKVASFGCQDDETNTPVVFFNLKTNKIVNGF